MTQTQQNDVAIPTAKAAAIKTEVTIAHAHYQPATGRTALAAAREFIRLNRLKPSELD